MIKLLDSSSDELKYRYEQCSNCEHKKKIVCGKCGCIIWAKARILKESCPIGKWKQEKSK
jgi:ribosomal protein S27AE